MTSADPGPAQPRGRYVIHDRIAAGGMAAVHFGQLRGPAGFSRIVAIKKLHAQFAHDPDFVAMFLDEARMASRVRHPNVVSTLDFVHDGDEILLVLEYIAGESLARLLKLTAKRGEPAPIAVAVAIAAGMLHGLHAAHEARDDRGEPLDLVHRDVSPQNVLVGSDGTARVVDFGVAKATGRSQTTREGQLKGKIPYMAPEQLRAGEVSRQSDVWAAAVVLWEMLANQRLFDGESEGHIYSRILNERARPPSSVVPSIPRDLDAIVLRALQRSPDRRFATARDLALALEACVTPATPAQVGAWVEELAHDTLAARAAKLAAIERRGAAPELAPRVEAALAPASVAPASVAPAGVAVTATTLMTRPRWPWKRTAPLVGAGLALFAGVALRLALQSPGAPTAAIEAAPAIAASAPPAVIVAIEAPPASAAPPIAPASAAPLPAASAPRASSSHRARPVAAPAHGDDCRSRDAAGIWHIKPECL
jgi:serine/threonine-protein kinase